MIYLDNHATTVCDRRVVDQMLPWFSDQFANPHSTLHPFGRRAGEAIEQALESIGHRLGVSADSILLTSGATESNNLAIDGICRHPRQKRKHVITTSIDHPAVLDVVARLERDGFRVTRLPVYQRGHAQVGQVDLQRLATEVSAETALVSIHWANNEIGVIQPIREIAEIVHSSGALLHSDATQAVGRIEVNLRNTDVDLISASAHKFYGPKGVGFLTIGGGLAKRRIRLKPMIVGGGQQRGLRSGTMSPANAIGCAAALKYATEELDDSRRTIQAIRDKLWRELGKIIDPIFLNGPDFKSSVRLPGNLNLMLPNLEGAALVSATEDLCFSSGSACSSVDAKPSHVLTGIGLSEDQSRRSVRFGVGKFNTDNEITQAIEMVGEAYLRLA